MSKISVARMVHFRFEGNCLAAICIGINKTGNPNLGGFWSEAQTGPFAQSHPTWSFNNVPEGTEDGTWHWPERVDD